MKTLALTIAFLLCGTLGVAQENPKLPDLRAFLQLTSEQIGELEQEKIALREQLRPIAEAARAAHQELEAELNATAPDAEAVLTLLQTIRNYKKQMQELGAAHVSAMQAVLTEDQLDKLNPLRLAFRLRKAAHQAAELRLLVTPPAADSETQ